MNRGMLLIIFSLFFLSCDDSDNSLNTLIKGHYYFKSEYPVNVSINDIYKDKTYGIANELDYYFSVYESDDGFVRPSCIKINSDVKQNIHIEITLTRMNLDKPMGGTYDIYDDNFEYCY